MSPTGTCHTEKYKAADNGRHAPDNEKARLYPDLAKQIDALLAAETDCVANLANAAAAIFHGLPSLNWAGFYLLRGQELVLGPFQGKPACVRIPLGQGVCGTAAAKRQAVLVQDVHEFPGHIACDAASRSELVVPLIAGDESDRRPGSGQPASGALRCAGSGGLRGTGGDHRAPSYIRSARLTAPPSRGASSRGETYAR